MYHRFIISLLGCTLTLGSLTPLSAQDAASNEDLLSAIQTSAYLALMRGDEALKGEQWEQAQEQYRESLSHYERIRGMSRSFKEDIIAYRTSYCANKIKELERRIKSQAAPAPLPTESDLPAGTAPDKERYLKLLQETVQLKNRILQLEAQQIDITNTLDSTQAALKKSLAEHTRLKTDLKDRVLALKKQVDEKAKDREASETNLAQMRSTNLRLREENDSLKANVEHGELAIGSVRNLAKEKEAEAANSRKQVEALQAKLAQLTKESKASSELLASAKKIQKELEALKAQATQAREAQKAAQAEIKHLQEALSQAGPEVQNAAKMSAQVKTLETERQELQSRVTELEKSLKKKGKTAAEAAALQAELTQCETDLKAAKKLSSSAEKIQKELEALKTRMTKATETQKTADAKIKTLEDALSKAEPSVEKAAQLTAQVKALETERKELKVRVTELEKSNQDASKAAADARASQTELSASKTALEAQLKKSREVGSELSARLKEQQATHQETIKSLESELSQQEADRAQWTLELEQAAQAILTATAKTQQQAARIKDLEFRTQGVGAVEAKYEAARKTQEKALANETAKLTRLENEYSQLEKKWTAATQSLTAAEKSQKQLLSQKTAAEQTLARQQEAAKKAREASSRLSTERDALKKDVADLRNRLKEVDQASPQADIEKLAEAQAELKKQTKKLAEATQELAEKNQREKALANTLKTREREMAILQHAEVTAQQALKDLKARLKSFPNGSGAANSAALVELQGEHSQAQAHIRDLSQALQKQQQLLRQLNVRSKQLAEEKTTFVDTLRQLEPDQSYIDLEYKGRKLRVHFPEEPAADKAAN